MATSDAEHPRHDASVAASVTTGGLAVMISIGAIGYALDAFRLLGVGIYTEQFLAGMLALALALGFLNLPARRNAPRDGAPWYDWLAAGLSFALASYVAIDYPRFPAMMATAPWPLTAVCVLLLAAVLETLRRAAGNVLVGLCLFFIVYALLGHLVPGRLQLRQIAFEDLMIYLAVDANAVLGSPLAVSVTVVIAFVLMGQLLFLSRGSEFFTDLSLVLMRRQRGGGAKIAVVASALFGTISGSAVSNVASTGVVTIPLMRQGGYAPHQAAAIEATASTGGQLMPPVMGAAAFLMAEFLQIPYREVMLAALVPSLLYYLALFLQADLLAAKGGMARIDAAAIPPILPVLRGGGTFILPFAVLIVGLFNFNLEPSTAALYASLAIIFAGVVLGYKGNYMRLSQLGAALETTGYAVLEILLIAAAAGIVIGVLNVSGLGFALTLSLVQLGGGNMYVLLILTAAVCILLGMGMPTTGVYVLLAALVAPALIQAGIGSISAHLFVLYFGMMSMITPPVAFAAFAAATLANADPMRTGFEAAKFGWPAYVVPFLFVASPSLLLQGSAWELVLAVATAIGGVGLVTIGVTGYVVRPLKAPVRTAFVVSGIALMIPAGAFDGAIWTDIGGFVAGGALLIREFVGARRGAAPSNAVR